MESLIAHLILRGMTSHNWKASVDLITSLNPDSGTIYPKIWHYQLCAECKNITDTKTFCPIVFLCVYCTPSLKDLTYVNRYNWTQSLMFKLNKLSSPQYESLNLAMEKLYEITKT